jgi:large subunit ribosomal protein L9
MKVLLKEDVENLGYAGEVHKVSSGYGRNFLLPRGLAVQASEGVLKAAQTWRDRAAARRAELKAEFEALAARISDVTLTFSAKAGESGKLYGSVTSNDVADQLNEALGTDIDRRKVVNEPLRQLGKHDVVVKLSADVQAIVKVVIESDAPAVPEEAEVDEAAAVPADEEAYDDEEDAIEDDYEDWEDGV